jgi:hypothetical protein
MRSNQIRHIHLHHVDSWPESIPGTCILAQHFHDSNAIRSQYSYHVYLHGIVTHGTNENFMESQHVNIFQSLPNTRISMWVQLSGAQIHSGADEVELLRAILDAISMPVFSNTFPTLRDLQRG